MAPTYPCETAWPPMALSYFTATVGIILMTFVVVGNFLICLAVVKDPLKTLRTPFMYFMVNAAVSDFLVGIIAMPSVTIALIFEIKRSKSEYSQNVSIVRVIFYALSSASNFSVAVLSIERYICVVHPFVYRQKLNFKKCVIISALIWILSIGLAMLYIKVGHRVYHMIYVHYSVAVILGVVVFTYIRIYRRVDLPSRQVNNLQVSKTPSNMNVLYGQHPQKIITLNSGQNKAVTRLRVFVRLLLTILVLYMILYLPVLVLSYNAEFGLDWKCDIRHVLRDVVYILLTATSAINPFMCTLRLRPFRKAIRAIFFHRKAMNYEIDYEKKM